MVSGLTLVTALGKLMLLHCACVNSQTVNEYATIAVLDNCGQSCNSSCEATDGVCRCDSECERYGDCCSGKVDCDGGEQRTQLLAGLQCRSIHLNSRTQPDRTEAFWMVSACPEDWLADHEDEELREADEKCRNGSNTLPPVTDLDSGVVYKNEYCALCHQVENIQPWGYRFGCRHIPCPTNQKMPCSFRAPQTELPPRTCLHGSLVVDDCLAREQLEVRTGSRWEEGVYQDVVESCKTGSGSPVSTSAPPTYRNQYCAICNGERTAELSCADPYDSRDMTNEDTGSGIVITVGETETAVIDSIATLFGNVTVTVVPISMHGTACPKSEVYDLIEQSCRPINCSEGFVVQQGFCAIVQNVTLAAGLNSTNNSLVICDGEFIVLDEDEFTLIDNDKFLFHEEGMFKILDYNDSLLIICSNFNQGLDDYSQLFFILTYVGCSLSVIGCVVVLLTYSLFKELRSLPGQILMNLASAILAIVLIVLIGLPLAHVHQNITDKPCVATAILLHWLLLSQFSWMSIMSFELLRTFYRASHLLQVEEKSTRKKIFLLYFLIGWGIPTAIAIISVIVYSTTDLNGYGYGQDGVCWISHAGFYYTVYMAPALLCITFNGITFTVTVSLLFKASRAQAKLNKQQSISYLRVSFSVFSITGLTWVFGFLSILVEADWARYTFIVLTSTEGFVICLAFVFTQKIGVRYKRLLFPSSSHEKTSSKNKAKQHTKENPSLVEDIRKSGDNRLAQEDAGPTERALQKKNGDQVSIEMDNIQDAPVRDQEIADNSA